MSTCRSCRAAVVFVPSAKSGRSMILDAEPRKGVVVTIDHHDEPGGAPNDVILSRAEVEQALEAIDEPLAPRPEARVVDVYTDHHATCPNAAEWRR